MVSPYLGRPRKQMCTQVAGNSPLGKKDTSRRPGPAPRARGSCAVRLPMIGAARGQMLRAPLCVCTRGGPPRRARDSEHSPSACRWTRVRARECVLVSVRACLCMPRSSGSHGAVSAHGFGNGSSAPAPCSPNGNCHSKRHMRLSSRLRGGDGRSRPLPLPRAEHGPACGA